MKAFTTAGLLALALFTTHAWACSKPDTVSEAGRAVKSTGPQTAGTTPANAGQTVQIFSNGTNVMASVKTPPKGVEEKKETR